MGSTRFIYYDIEIGTRNFNVLKKTIYIQIF